MGLIALNTGHTAFKITLGLFTPKPVLKRLERGFDNPHVRVLLLLYLFNDMERYTFMTQVGDVLQIKDCQTLFNQTMCNMFYYIVAVWTGNSALSDVLDGFDEFIVPGIADIQGEDVNHFSLRVDNLSDEIGFANLTIDVDGTRTESNTLPSYVAASFRLDRATKLTRPGFKRFGGIQEDQVVENRFANTDQAALDLAALIEAVLNIDADGGGDIELRPVIVGRNASGGFDLERIADVTSASALLNISSQVSRRA